MKNKFYFALSRVFLLGICGISVASAISVARGEENKCAERIPEERFTEFLSQMRFNMSFRNGEIVGFRIYEKSKPGVLAELGMRSEDLLTHFCGVKVFEAMSAKPTICCKTAEPMRNGVELTVERDGKVIRVVTPMPNKRVQATRSKQRAHDA